MLTKNKFIGVYLWHAAGGKVTGVQNLLGVIVYNLVVMVSIFYPPYKSTPSFGNIFRLGTLLRLVLHCSPCFFTCSAFFFLILYSFFPHYSYFLSAA